jgi:hypothetical protein
VKCSRNEGYRKGEDRRGEWLTKVVSVIPGMGWHSSRSVADVAQIHPKINREELACTCTVDLIGRDLRAPGMKLALLSKVFQFHRHGG